MDIRKAKLAHEQLKEELTSEIKILENKLDEVNNAYAAFKHDNELQVVSKDDAIRSLDESIIN